MFWLDDSCSPAHNQAVRKVSRKRREWLQSYKKMLRAWEPTECARCGRPGRGWVNFGGNFEAHHIARRTTEWKCCLFVPFCTDCHQWAESHSKAAREDHWIIKPRSKFDRETMG
jgi:hypothetical protein